MKALNGVSLSVEKGEFVAVVGTSGSGKIHSAAYAGRPGPPDSGKVYVDGKDIFSLKEEALTIFRRRKIGFVFQAYNLVPVLSVYENVVLPVELDGEKGGPGIRTGDPGHAGDPGKGEEPSGAAVRRPAAAGGHRAGPGGGNRPFFCAMSPREIWTAVPPRTFWAC